MPDAAGRKPVVLCADDFGMNAEVDAGIVDLASTGRLSMTSCMSLGPAFRQDIQRLDGLPIETGLHLNLTEAIGDYGFCQPLPQLIRSCYTRRLDRRTLHSEIGRQLDAFESATGRAPDYIDGHQHVHQFPIVRDCLVDIMLARYKQPYPWLRSTLARRRSGLSATLRLKAAVIEWLGAGALRKLAARHGIPTTRHLLGAYGFDGGEAGYAALLGEWLRLSEPGDLIMCHPARGLNRDDPLAAQRCAEHAVLSGPRLPELLQRHNAYVAPGMAFA